MRYARVIESEDEVILGVLLSENLCIKDTLLYMQFYRN